MSDAAVHGLAGVGGGALALLLTYPLLAANTRQHTERRIRTSTGDLKVVVEKVPQGTLQQIVRILRTDGIGGLYKGLHEALVGTACSQGIYYYFYELQRGWALKAALKHSDTASVSTLTTLAMAASAGAINVLLTNPVWVLVTRMQTESQVRRARLAALQQPSDLPLSPAEVNELLGPPATTLSNMLDIYTEAGLLGFWKGVLPSLIMVGNPALQFMFYELLKDRLTLRRKAGKSGLKHVSSAEVFLLGALAKLGATVLTYPLLVVKSRLQAKQEIGGDSAHRYSGTLDAIGKMLKHEGVSIFYKGMSTKICQSVLAAAILFATKEELVKVAKAALQKKPVTLANTAVKKLSTS